MTDADLMDANCIHGVVWYECKECERATNAELIADAYRATRDLFAGFDVNWINDTPTGLMLHCRVCGVHDWAPTETRTLLNLVESAFGHRQVCQP